jgi:hypothetical protein
LNIEVQWDKLPVVRRGAVVMLALLAACSSGSDDADGATTTERPTTTEAETTTTTSAPDPFTVPDDPADIDEAYVEAVLAELEHINGDALRLAVSEGLSPEVRELIESANAFDQAAREIETMVQLSITGFEGVAAPPGDVVLDVQSILVASATCIAADVVEDYRPVGPEGVSGVRTRIELVSSEGSNPTPWRFSLRHALEAEEAPPSPCAS